MARLEKIPVEIVGEICELLDAHAFRSLRLVCREVAAKSHDAFIRRHVRVVHVNVDEYGLHRLAYLAQFEALAPLMHTLHLYPSVMAESFDQDLFTMHFMRTPSGSIFRAKDHASLFLHTSGPNRGMNEYTVWAQQMHNAKVSQRTRFLRDPNKAWSMLARAMVQFKHITTLTIGAQDRTERFDGSTGQLVTGPQSSSSVGDTDRSLEIVLDALTAAQFAIQNLKIGQPGGSTDTSAFRFPVRLTSHWGLKLLQCSIRSLEVCLGNSPKDTSSGDKKAFSEFLSKAAKLEHLKLIGDNDMYIMSPALSASTLQVLKRLELSNCNMNAEIFRNFVERHQETLASIVLRSVIMFTKEWYSLLDFLSGEEFGLDALSLEHIRACSAQGIFGCLVFDTVRTVDCLFCGEVAEENAKPCEHVRLSASNKGEIPELRQKLQQCECRIL